MAQTGYTPIQLYRTATPAAAPAALDLLAGELAINTADGKLFYKDSGGSVQVLATKDAAGGVFTTVDTTNIEVTNIKAKDGTAAGSIADSTGVVTFGSTILTTTDINGGTIDGATIGGTTPAAGTFTTLTSNSTTTLNGTTIPASKTLVDTDSSQTLTNKTLSTGIVLSTDQPAVISVNSSSNALRITQTGAGNALVVEDSANPDATPFVVDAAGRVIVGNTASRADAGLVGNDKMQIEGVDYAGSSLALISNYSVNAGNQSNIEFVRTRAGAVGGNTIVQSGDYLGAVNWFGADGVDSMTSAAQIRADVDGTPGTNDMPGRLVFSTTADGASSPTERMRIDSAGQVGIGASTTNGINLRLGRALTGGTTAIASSVLTTLNSDATAYGAGYTTSIATQAATFTCNRLDHFSAYQGAFGAGSTVTAQVGFRVDSSLISATSNYGFYSDIASGTGRWNFYANGTADNYFAGNVGIGATPGTRLDVSGNWVATIGTMRINGASGQQFSGLTIANNGSVRTFFYDDNTNNYTFLGATTGKDLVFATNTNGTGSERMRIDSSGNVGIGTSSPGHKLDVSGSINATNGTNAVLLVGSDGNIELSRSSSDAFIDFKTSAAEDFDARIQQRSNGLAFDTGGNGTTAERMRIDSSGNVGIGVAPAADATLHVAKNITGGVNAQAVRVSGTIQSDVTSLGRGFNTVLATAAASFTLTNIQHFSANQGTFGAGSAVTNQIGFVANSSLIGATNNYGFYSDISSGTGRWNFYAAGTAQNHFAGDLLVGTASLLGANNYGAAILPAGKFVASINSAGSALDLYIKSDGTFAYFVLNGTIIGSISGSGTTTAYNTSSDYRLKNVEGEIYNSGAYIDSLRPVHGTWKADGSKFIGLIAHEVQEVSQTQVATGTKDGEEMQAMDYSNPELIANLIAEVKSLRRRVAQLESV